MRALLAAILLGALCCLSGCAPAAPNKYNVTVTYTPTGEANTICCASFHHNTSNYYEELYLYDGNNQRIYTATRKEYSWKIEEIPVEKVVAETPPAPKTPEIPASLALLYASVRISGALLILSVAGLLFVYASTHVAKACTKIRNN